MYKILSILTTLLFIQPLFAQSNVIPRVYQPIREVSGDLDKDKINEKVVVYNIPGKDDEENGIERELIVFKKVGEQWMVWHRSKNVVGNSKDGGMMGDPLGDIEIKNGILLIHQSGGSSWKWAQTDKYRYQHNRFELIGYSNTYGKPCEYWLNFDFNIITGKIVVTKEYEKCETEDRLVVYKKENETFSFNLKKKITLANRNTVDVKIISPKYKHEIYL